MKTNWPITAFAVLFICCGSDEPSTGSDNRVDASDGESVPVLEKKPQKAVLEIEKVGPIAVVPVEVRGFEKLSLSTKTQIYHHALAAMAGDGILTYQLCPMNLVIKRVLDGISEAGNKVPLPLRRKIEPYRKLFSIYHGNYDAIAGEKILPTFIPGELAAAAQIAVNAGIDLGVDDFQGAELGANQLERLEAFLAAMRPWIFDRRVVPTGARANPLHPKSDKPGGKGTEQTNPVGNGEEAAAQLLSVKRANLIGHLTNSLPGIEPDKKSAMENLIGYFQTGNRASYNRYIELWSETNSEVETFIGLANPRPDIASRNGAFEALVMIRDTELSALMHKAAGLATHYRRQMPLGKRHKRGTFEPAVPSVYNAVVATGNAGPFTRSIMDVPSDPQIAKKYGGKRFYLTNVTDARDRVIAKKALFEFSADQEVADRRSRWYRVARNDFLVLSEVIGRGMVRSGLERVFGADAKPLEEMFCALAALYLVFDPKNQEIGLVPTEESAKAMYDGYVSGMLEQLAGVGDTDTLAEPEMRARQAIVRFVIEKGAAELIFEGGQLYVRVIDYQAMRSAIRELLSKVHIIMISGDTGKGRRLITKLGTAFPPAWRIDVQRRFANLGLSGVVGFSYPTPVPRLDDTGKIVDVVLK